MRESSDGVRLVEETARVLSVRRKVVRHDAVDTDVPAYLEDRIEDATHGVSYHLVGYGVDVVEDAHRLLELLDLYRIRVERVVELDSFFGLILSRLSSDGRLEHK